MPRIQKMWDNGCMKAEGAIPKHAAKFGGRHPMVSVKSAKLYYIRHSSVVAARVQIVVSYHFLKFVRERMGCTAIDFFVHFYFLSFSFLCSPQHNHTQCRQFSFYTIATSNNSHHSFGQFTLVELETVQIRVSRLSKFSLLCRLAYDSMHAISISHDRPHFHANNSSGAHHPKSLPTREINMYLNTLVSLCVTGLLPFAVTQMIDPNSVDQTTKGKNIHLRIPQCIC